MVDARRAYTDPTHEVSPGSWTLLELEQNADGTTLTLVTSARYESGGGLFAESRGGFTCYTLRVAPDASWFDTKPSDCTDGQGHGLSDLFDVTETEIVPLAYFDVQRTLDASDHEPLPCQCSSGGECDCPGGLTLARDDTIPSDPDGGAARHPGEPSVFGTTCNPLSELAANARTSARHADIC